MFIIPENKRSIGRSLLEGLSQGIPTGLAQSLASMHRQREQSSEAEAKAKRTQNLLSGIFRPGSTTSQEDLLPNQDSSSLGSSILQATPEQRLMMKLSGDPGLSAAADYLDKQEERKNTEGLSNEDYSSILDEMEDSIDKGGAGWLNYIKGPFSEEASEFQSKGTALLGLAQKVALKQGIRNQREFDLFVQRTVPNNKDTKQQARGKIKALRSYLHKDFGKQNTSSKGFVKMKTPDGRVVKVPHDQAEAASAAGGRLVK